MFGAQIAALFTVRGIVTLIGLAAIAALIWFGGPYVDLFGQQPLASPFARSMAIAGLFAIVLIVTLTRYWLARRANRRVIKSLMDSEGLIATSDNRSQEEVELIRERFEDALKVLRDTVFPGKRGPSYLFELPWYIIIGPPGAGKTTILRNSGLEFPLAERLGVDPVAGFGGTRNCDWWFTEEAVLIDTAGRYTTQDTNAEVDRAAWRGFLDLLATHRRRRPINGILVAISLSDLLLRDEGGRRRHIEAIRSRIQELLKTFGMQIPAYVLITKCDLVSGFSEYFDSLDESARAQVWGKTFPIEGPGDRLVDVTSLEMQELAERLEVGLPARLHEERNLSRRATMYAFPKEFWGVRNAIASFVGEVFRSSRFEGRPMLRGIYFTSGTQEGTPIDRVIGALSRNFGLQSGQRASPLGQGKAFFIRRLLTDVIFAEQGLVGRNSKLERKLALVHGGGYVAALSLMVGALLLWYGAFTRSDARISDTKVAAEAAQARLREVRGPADLKALLPALNAARQVRVATGEDSWFAWLDGVGISATPALAPLAQSAYDRVLIDSLLPAFANRLVARIDALLRTGNDALVDQVKEAFRTYLMLGDPAHFDRAKIAQAMRDETALAFALDPTGATQTNTHFNRLIELLPKPINIDAPFADRVRARLTRRPQVDQVYARLLREAAQNPRLRAIDLVSLLGPGQLEISQPRAAQIAFPALDQQDSTRFADAAAIPGIFTRDGFNEFMLPRLPLLVREEQGADWVLAGGPIDSNDTQQIVQKVADRYVADYIRVWTNALQSVRVVRFDDMRRGSAVLRGLAGPQSSLQQLLSTVRDNTTLPAPGERVAAQAGGAGGAVGAQLASAAGDAANAAFTAGFGNAPWPGTRITEAFRPLAQLAMAGAGGQPAAMDRVRDLFGGLYAVLANVATAPDPGQAAFQMVQRRVKDQSNDAFGALRADSAIRPEPVRTIMNDIAMSTWQALLKQAHEYVDAVWTREVVPVCQGVIFQRYPMYASATEDVTLKDFGDFFRPGGVVDDFFQKYLSALVVDRRTGLAPASIDGATAPLRTDALAQFQRAREIRNAFFSGSGSAPAVKFSIKPVFLDPSLLRATFVMDGKEVVYRHEQPRAYDLEWPTRTEASTASVTLADLEGKEEKVERSGPWALFRLVDASQLSSRGATDRFTITIGKADGPKVTYELRAASVTNPFSLSVLRSFRCPDNL
ncbi:type VI secretion system membrane subunit TssM [Microbacteriaceae bacterium K1510]|nr:type VI secretion system membrane subunit TssM [Microbacteriaceae bacterium K1510]